MPLSAHYFEGLEFTLGRSLSIHWGGPLIAGRVIVRVQGRDSSGWFRYGETVDANTADEAEIRAREIEARIFGARS